jgi:UDPglucose 6-dehydrogenase
MKIAVIGAGYVGLVSAACFAELGHEVVTVDMDKEKVAQLRAGGVPIHEDLLPELLQRHRGKGLSFSTDIQAAFHFCDVAFICVGTPPSPNGDADLSFVEGVARELAFSLDRHKVIVEKSTVPVGTCEAVCRTMVLHGARRISASRRTLSFCARVPRYVISSSLTAFCLALRMRRAARR